MHTLGVPATDLEGERKKFLALITLAHTQAAAGKPNVIIVSASSSVSRGLRRKFYRLREELVNTDQLKMRELADDITFKLYGRRIELVVQTDYMKNISLGVSNASGNSGESSASATDESTPTDNPVPASDRQHNTK